MTDYDVLETEEELCDAIWEANYQKEKAKGNEYANLEHEHICDFVLCHFNHCKNHKQLNKIVRRKCEEYLASIGETYNEMNSCDYCIHDRFITISKNIPDLVLNISTPRLICCKNIDKLREEV